MNLVPLCSFFFHTTVISSLQLTSYLFMENFFVFSTVAVKSSILDKDAVHRVISIMLASDEVGEESPTTSTSTHALCIINAFDISKFRYDPIKKIFHLYVFLPFIFI